VHWKFSRISSLANRRIGWTSRPARNARRLEKDAAIHRGGNDDSRTSDARAEPVILSAPATAANAFFRFAAAIARLTRRGKIPSFERDE
jgi:hypothetical protein